MKTAVAIRHVCFEDLGTLEGLLEARGYKVSYFDAPVDDFKSLDAITPDLIVVLGGPVGAFDGRDYPFLLDERDVIRERVDSDRPLLGICLGAQLIARALGADVAPMGVKEIGFSPLDLTRAGLGSPLAVLKDVPVLHWHGDEFDIPPGAIRLAGTDVCMNQAFAYGSNVLALQCHLEADATKLERWLVGHACELSLAGIDPQALREQAAIAQALLPAAARAVFNRWLDIVERPAMQALT